MNNRPEVCPKCGAEKIEENESCDIFSCGTIVRYAPPGLEYPMGSVERSNGCYDTEIAQLEAKVAAATELNSASGSIIAEINGARVKLEDEVNSILRANEELNGDLLVANERIAELEATNET